MTESIQETQDLGAEQKTISAIPNKISSFEIIDQDDKSQGVAQLTADWKDIVANELSGDSPFSLKDLLLKRAGGENEYYLMTVEEDGRVTLKNSIMEEIVQNHQLLKRKLFGIGNTNFSFIDENAATVIAENFKPRGFTLVQVNDKDGNIIGYYPKPTDQQGQVTPEYAQVLADMLINGSLFQNLLEQSYWWTNAMGEPYNNGNQNGSSIMNHYDMLIMFPVMISSSAATVTSNEGE